MRRCLADEGSVLLLYSLLQGNPDFLEYVLVRTDLDTLVSCSSSYPISWATSYIAYLSNATLRWCDVLTKFVLLSVDGDSIWIEFFLFVTLFKTLLPC